MNKHMTDVILRRREHLCAQITFVETSTAMETLVFS